jgi:hypothetical protein
MKLQEIVDGEPKESPYSDDDLVDELGKRGITVARRTVTKYRKAMKIPSSRQRRDWKIVRDDAGNGGDTVPAVDEGDDFEPTNDIAEDDAAGTMP